MHSHFGLYVTVQKGPYVFEAVSLSYNFSLRPGGSSSLTLPPGSVCMDNMDTLVVLNDLEGEGFFSPLKEIHEQGPISTNEGICEELPVSVKDIRDEAPMQDILEEAPMEDIREKAPMEDIREKAPMEDIREKAPSTVVNLQEAPLHPATSYIEVTSEEKPTMPDPEKHGAERPSEDQSDDAVSISPVQDTFILMGLTKHFFRGTYRGLSCVQSQYKCLTNKCVAPASEACSPELGGRSRHERSADGSSARQPRGLEAGAKGKGWCESKGEGQGQARPTKGQGKGLCSKRERETEGQSRQETTSCSCQRMPRNSGTRDPRGSAEGRSC